MHVRHVPKSIERDENCSVLINRKKGQPLRFNGSRGSVWGVREDSTIEDIIKKVVDEFDIDEKTGEEQIPIIESLRKKGVIGKEE